MQFAQQPGGVWHLIDETAPPGANLIAAVNGPVEALALKGLCEVVATSRRVSDTFTFHHDGRAYRVEPYSDRDNRLSLRIAGEDGSLSRVETEFRWPASAV